MDPYYQDVRRGPRGAFAIRVREPSGVYCWRLVHPNGDTDTTDADLSPEVWVLVPRAVAI